MKVKLLVFTILSVPHNLYVTDSFEQDAGIPDAGPSGANEKTLASFCVMTTSVYLRHDLSAEAALRSFFHEIYEITLSTLGFRYDPYDPHAAFSSLSDILFGVVLENSRLLFHDVFASAFRACVVKHFGAAPEPELGPVSWNIGVDTGPGKSKTVRHWCVGGFHIYRDELDHRLQEQFPGADPLSDAEIKSVLTILGPMVTERAGVLEDDVKEAVRQVVLQRADKAESGPMEGDEAKC